MNNIKFQQLKTELNFLRNSEINKIVEGIPDDSSLPSVLDTINSRDTEKGRNLVALFSYIIDNCNFITNSTVASCAHGIAQLLEKTELHREIQRTFNNAITKQTDKIQQYALTQQTQPQLTVATLPQRTELSS
jgi:hypothetical protein